MKVKKLVALALPIALLSGVVGCSDNKTTDKKVESKVETKSDKKEVTELSAEEYKQELALGMKDISERSLKLNSIINDRSKPISEVAKEYRKEAEMFIVTANKVAELRPPSKFKESHKVMMEAMDLARQGTNECQGTLDNADPSLPSVDKGMFKTANNMLSQASSKINEAHEIMKKVDSSIQ
ncbi:hypothetical protein WAZ07_16855 [Bacillus sp. FJAT-51639]|uniref:Lipoprotein n=1 Tax=Bacillus bruguierae TaxID=3127667 RepID=A0ABU8FJT7_9BACI